MNPRTLLSRTICSSSKYGHQAHIVSQDSAIMERWRRLALQKGLDPEKDEKKYRKERSAFIAKEVKKGFSLKFGDDANNIQGWKALCRIIRINDCESFTSVKQCRTVCVAKFVSSQDELIFIMY
jgi:hypothetical protein